MNRVLTILAVLIAQAIPVTAESREKDLDQWLDRELVPHVRQQLLTHPRFKGETVMFVVLKENAPAAVSNALAISLRDRLLDAAVRTAGIAVGWQQGRSHATSTVPAHACERDEVHYYIGVELTQNLDSNYSVRVRALDLDDRSWVAGFGKSWQGRLGTVHRQALRQSRTDSTFRGGREVPYTATQSDLVAAHLAHELSCALLRRTGGDYVVDPEELADRSGALEGTVEMVGYNLARKAAIELTGEEASSNAVLSGTAHRIDGDLYQYWLTITPADPDGALSSLSASAYVRLPGDSAPAAPVPTTPAVAEPGAQQGVPARATVSIPNAGEPALLGPLNIAAANAADCSGTARGQPASLQRWQSRCSLLQTEARGDAIVFFLAYQANLGLVRLGGMECRVRTVARVARAGESMNFPIPRTVAGAGTGETLEWLIEPERDTYYAVALTDARSARAIANHIDRLPLRCTRAARPGLEGSELRAWLDDFSMLAARSRQHFDWRALAVRNVL